MSRAISPALGAVLLALITVALAGVLTASVGTATLGQPQPDFVRISADAEPDGTISLTHKHGHAIDVRQVTVVVSVEGEQLAQQPPVPFFSTAGFEAGPTGPFNSAADPEWTVGEQASFTIADSNTPAPRPGDEIKIELYEDGHPLAEATTSLPGHGGE